MKNGEAIKKAREKKGLTQAQLAANLGVTEKTLRGWELGKVKLIAARMIKAARSLGYDSWESLYQASNAAQSPPIYENAVPILAEIPASFGADGIVHSAFGYEEPIGHLPSFVRHDGDTLMFGLIIRGDSMSPKYTDGSQVACSPKHWQDHGFVSGYDYAIRLANGDTTIKTVHLIDNGQRLELVAINSAHATMRINADEVQLAALVCGAYRKNQMPEMSRV